QTAGFTIVPLVKLASLTMSASTLTGGVNVVGTVTLDSPAVGTAAQRKVTLSDDNDSATTPASVTVALGATTATFTVTTIQVAASTPVTITATINGSTQTAGFTLTP